MEEAGHGQARKVLAPVRLDLVSRTHMRGKAEVFSYFGNYA